jgi:DNA-binding transcriptional ArsR family regulator
MEDRITLDRETFKTLASGTRVNILKSLDRRRKMLTELSKEFGMSPSTIKEHMDNLTKAELVVQIDDGHKWKYYELTSKGREILHPSGSRVYIILGLSLFALIFTTWDLFKNTFSSLAPMFSGAGDAITKAPEAAQEFAPGASLLPTIPYFHILGLIVFASIFGISLGYLLARKANPPVLD